MKYEVIYLTGAPATGKSTLTKYLKKNLSNLLVFEYGAELTKYISSKNFNVKRQEDLRSKSSLVVTSNDVKFMDDYLIKLVAKERLVRHIIIDSHAVTKEFYGYRVTAFSLKKLMKIKPTKIVVLYTDSKTTIKRIKKDSGGRPLISNFEADYHTFLQGSVALNYGINLGLPIYYIDSSTHHNLANLIIKILKI